MKKLVLTLVCLILTAQTVFATHARMRYIEGKTSASYQDPDTDKWSVVPVRVYVLIGKKKSYDDLTYIVVDLGKKKTEAFLMERGIPGQPNVATRQEREKFLKALRKGQKLLEKAQEEPPSYRRTVGYFINFDLDLMPVKNGEEPRIRMYISNIETREKTTVYLNRDQIEKLISLIEVAPKMMDQLKAENLLEVEQRLERTYP